MKLYVTIVRHLKQVPVEVEFMGSRMVDVVRVEDGRPINITSREARMARSVKKRTEPGKECA